MSKYDDTLTYSIDIPVLFVSGQNLPEAWEKAVLAVYDNGLEIKTEYDKPEDLPSLDATVMVEIIDPMSEPRIHKNFPGGPCDLEIYRQEVVKGIHDHWINPLEGKWTYTYHQRLRRFPNREGLPIDQLALMMKKIDKTPYTRRAQAITWDPVIDPPTHDPPCLQRLWGRMVWDQEKSEWRFNLNAHWRSRDLYKAWFMNVFAITDLQRYMAEEISRLSGKKVVCGRYMDISDSLHIYGSYRIPKFEDEIKKMRQSPYTDRAWNSEILEAMFMEARANLEKDPDYYAHGSDY